MNTPQTTKPRPRVCEGCGHRIKASDRLSACAPCGGGVTDWCGRCNAGGLLLEDDNTPPRVVPHGLAFTLVAVCLLPDGPYLHAAWEGRDASAERAS